jgi:predicted dehydrogenase
VMMDEIAGIIFDKKPSSISGEEGLKDALVMEAIYKSIETGKKVKV